MRVAGIVAAAEQAAEELRSDAERRAGERIAEADRAAAMRVQAADEEAMELRGEASQYATQARGKAAASARELLEEARTAARTVLRDGEQISGNLRELGEALRANAELLLRDVRIAHAELTARLDRADPASWDGAGFGHRPVATHASTLERADELEVPSSSRARRRDSGVDDCFAAVADVRLGLTRDHRVGL